MWGSRYNMSDIEIIFERRMTTIVLPGLSEFPEVTSVLLSCVSSSYCGGRDSEAGENSVLITIEPVGSSW